MLAILVKAKVLTNEGAERLSKKLGSEIHRAEYTDAVQTIEDVLKEYRGELVAEPWVAQIKALEKRVRDLEEVALMRFKGEPASPKKPTVRAPRLKAVTANDK